ncbi:hypothetical protein APS67_000651 [Streptomyces sp. AVP053U2]|nr:hypothetical protein APS67_000651 [Streptomyces sp. AVP053U2]
MMLSEMRRAACRPSAPTGPERAGVGDSASEDVGWNAVPGPHRMA